MSTEEFYKDFFGVEPKENSTTVNQSVLAFAEQYAKHHSAETLSELERVKEELEITNQALDQAAYRAVKAEKELEAYKKHIFNSASEKTGSNI